MLAFIDQIVIPFLASLYGATGYLGVTLAMAIESAMIPLPSELILPFAGFMVSDPSQIEPLTGGPVRRVQRRQRAHRLGAAALDPFWPAIARRPHQSRLLSSCPCPPPPRRSTSRS